MKNDQHSETSTPFKGTVSVCFADEAINEIFCALLEAQGVKTTIVRDIRLASTETRVITEPQYLPHLKTSLKESCLVVGNIDPRVPQGTLLLARPLTEEKIETALSRFLAD